LQFDQFIINEGVIVKIKQLLSGAILSSLFLTGCSKELQTDGRSQNQNESGIWSVFQNKVRTLKVADSNGQPIANAQVLIGAALGRPFASNFITARADGTFEAPVEWTGSEVVTVAAPGYVRASFYGQTPQGQTFQLRTSQPEVQFELKGMGTGFQTKDSDNLVDFALMIPSVQRADLFSFNLNMFVSPEVDRITVYGNAIDLPSNLSLPRQKEAYGIIPVTLEKAQYRMYFDAMGNYQVVTLRGQFPFKQVVGDMQNGKSYLDIINYFSLKGGSLTSVSIGQSTQVQDLPVNSFSFTESRELLTPAFAKDEFLLTAALSPYQGQYIPTDFKNVPSNVKFKLGTAAGETPQLLVALKKKAEQYEMGGGKLSAALISFGPGVRPELLPLIEKPQVSSLTEVSAVLPNAPASIKPMATYMVLSSVSRQGSGATLVEETSRLWEVYAQDWQAEMHLPQWPDESLATGSLRWEISYLGAQNGSNKAVDLSPRILETVTHATHSATDF
jgi:hypothetical protein